jgi:hypothetical protein
MATRPGNDRQTTRKQGNGLAVATLGFGIVGLILGVVSPPALLLGFFAVVLEAGNLGRGAQAAQLGTPWHDRRWPPGLSARDTAVLEGLL